jgi:hypothetical protein
MREKVRITAMRESDLRELLREFGMANVIEQGNCKCYCCHSSLTWDDIGGIIMQDGKPIVVCSSAECIERAGGGE